MTEQTIPLVGQYGEFGDYQGILLATGDDVFTEFVPWLERIVRDAKLLGLELGSSEVERFLVEDLWIDCDSYVFDSGLPPASVFKLAWGDDETRDVVVKRASAVFARWAEGLMPDKENPMEGTSLTYVLTPQGEERWSSLLKNEHRTVLDGVLGELELQEVRTGAGVYTVAWEKRSDIHHAIDRFHGRIKPTKRGEIGEVFQGKRLVAIGYDIDMGQGLWHVDQMVSDLDANAKQALVQSDDLVTTAKRLGLVAEVEVEGSIFDECWFIYLWETVRSP